MTQVLEQRLHDEEGYLVEPEHWTEDIARRIAAGEGLALTEGHWKIIGYMRERYAERQVAPDARFVVKFMADELGASHPAQLLAAGPADDDAGDTPAASTPGSDWMRDRTSR